MYRNLLALTVLFLSVTQSFAESNEGKPNVIVILADDLGLRRPVLLRCQRYCDAAHRPDGAEGAKFTASTSRPSVRRLAPH